MTSAPTMKSTKYRKYRRSRSLFPTKVVRSGAGKGTLVVGDKAARKDIECQLGRELAANTKTRHTRSQWVFCEPRKRN